MRPSKLSLGLSRSPAKNAAPRAPEKPEPLPETISLWGEFYRVVRRIPRGRVCTYGAVAAMASHPRSARHVGFALAALKDSGKNADVPWQRVLGAKGKVRATITIKDPVGGAIQRLLLEAEGVEFDAQGNISLERFGWFLGDKKGTKTALAPKQATAKAKPKRPRKTSREQSSNVSIKRRKSV